MHNENKHVLILLSGGVDSTALINYYLNLNYSIDGLFIDYGQKSKSNEEIAVDKVAQHYKIPVTKIRVSSCKTFSSGEIIGRNLMLLSIALMNYSKDFGIIAIGIHDGTFYNDCKKVFVHQMQQIYDLYKDGHILIEAPFINLYKQDIWKFCENNKVPIDLTYSCESGHYPGCGLCLSCKDKIAMYGSIQKFNTST